MFTFHPLLAVEVGVDVGNQLNLVNKLDARDLVENCRRRGRVLEVGSADEEAWPAQPAEGNSEAALHDRRHHKLQRAIMV